MRFARSQAVRRRRRARALEDRSVRNMSLAACFGNVTFAELVLIEVGKIREGNVAWNTFVVIIAMFELPLVSLGGIMEDKGCIIAT